MTEILLLTDSSKYKWARLNRTKSKIASNSWKYRHGVEPMSKNPSCSMYLGVHIAERFLSKLFINVTRTPINFPGYDFICSKGHTIDVKSSCLLNDTDISRNRNDRWSFNIRKNAVAEYFLCLAFDNREDLNPKYIWLIPGNIINNHTKISVTNTPDGILKWSEYEQTEKLEKLVACCSTIKKGDST